MTDFAVKILAVDDNADNLTALGAILRTLGQEVVAAGSGRQALRELLRGDFAVILLDVNMPIMDGFETASLIRSRPRSEHTPIIFITASGDETHVARGYSLGAVDYILTPVVPEILRAKVGVFVELFRMTEEVRRQSASLRRRADQLRKLTEASLAINAAGSVEAILRAAADRSRALLEGTHATASAAFDRNRRFQVTVPEPQGEPAGCSRCEVAMRDRNGGDLGYLRVSCSADRELGDDDRAVLQQLGQITSIALQNFLFLEERETNLLKDEFLATISHELRTPLTAILTWARMLREGTLDPTAAARGAEVIERNARAQAQLIDDLLDISRIVTGKMRLESRVVDLRSIVSTAAYSLTPVAKTKSLTIHATHPKGAVPVIGDANRLQQVLWNLLSNAIKFSDRGGEIEIELDTEGDEATIRVADTGRGIDATFLPHVFDRFRQADSSTTRTQSGLGLGLAIVRHLVELHGGRVSARSDGEGRGATFVVRLPLFEARRSMEVRRGRVAVKPEARVALPDAAPRPDLSGSKVLVVDDEADGCEAIAMVLRSAGVEVRTAASVDAALELLSSWRPDVLLSDIGLPEEDGYGLLRKVRALEATAGVTLPAVAVTAYTQPQDRTRALLAGFHDHLAKPVDSDTLLAVVARFRPEVRLTETADPAAALVAPAPIVS